MIRRTGYLVVTVWIWALNTVERWHGRRTRKWNASHRHGAVTTRKPKP